MQVEQYEEGKLPVMDSVNIYVCNKYFILIWLAGNPYRPSLLWRFSSFYLQIFLKHTLSSADEIFKRFSESRFVSGLHIILYCDFNDTASFVRWMFCSDLVKTNFYLKFCGLR